MKKYIRELTEYMFSFQDSIQPHILTIGCVDLWVAVMARAGRIIDLENFCFVILALLIITCSTFVFMDIIAFIILGLFWIQEKAVELYKKVRKGSEEV